MEQRPARVLLIDEDESDYQLIQTHAASMPRGFCDLRWLNTYELGRVALSEGEFDVCLLDCPGNQACGMELLRHAIQGGCREPIIVMTGVAEPLLDMEAMKAGAADYLVKGEFDANRLERAIRHATERARLLKALAQERHLLHTLMDSIPDNIYFKDVAGRYIRVNRAKARRSGLQDPAEAVGRSDLDFFPAEHARRTLEDERLLMRTGESIIGQEERLVWPSGEISWASTTKVPFRNEQGQIIGTLGVSRDITRLKAAQEALRQAKEAAEAASRAKSEFLANISHEVRTPMNAILGMTELVLDTPLSSSQRENLRIAYESAQALLEMLDDILNFSEIEAGNLELCSGAFNVRECVAEVQQSLRPRAVQKGLELLCSIAPDTPELVIGDVNRLRQVLINLVGNAIKFTEQGHVAIAVTHHPESDGRVSLDFSVTDTGVGIPPDKLEAIFEAFQQADNSPTRRFGGPGLGLTISSRLVRLMGGEIEVESIERRGSKFRFSVRLPAATAADQPRSARKAPPVPPALPDAVLSGSGSPLAITQPPQEAPLIPRLRVLLAEDSLFNQKLAVGLLEKWGHEVVVAIHGAEAVEKLQAAHFDLVLMDVQMPHMDGYEATRLIRARERGTGQHVPIIAMTAHAMSGDRDRCLEAGMDGYVAKPVYARNLQAAIGDVFQRGAPQPAESQPDPPDPAADEPSAVDWDAAVSGVDGRRELLAELIQIFFTEYPELLVQVQQAVQKQDAQSLRASAHRLKGCLRYFGENRAGALAMELEECGRTGDWTGVPASCAGLQTAIQQMLPAMREFLDREGR